MRGRLDVVTTFWSTCCCGYMRYLVSMKTTLGYQMMMKIGP